MKRLRLALLAVLSLGFAPLAAFCEQDPGETRWRLTLETQWLGPVETTVTIRRDGDTLTAASHSGALDRLVTLPNAPPDRARFDRGLLVFEAQRAEDGVYRGRITAPWAEDEIELTIEGDRLSGQVSGTGLSGPMRGLPAENVGALRDYPAIADRLFEVVEQRIFEPADLESDAFRRFRRDFDGIAEAASDDFDFLLGFVWGWSNDPFSHFSLRRSPVNAAEMVAWFDGMQVGPAATALEFRGDTAILTVNTMMGQDTIVAIDRAYEAIAEAGAKSLVIDLRQNNGGAFAVKPLVEHVLAKPLDAGYFVAHRWNVAHDRLPAADELSAIDPWHGWSIIDFWRDVQQQGVMRIEFTPAEPHFAGPVLVLTSPITASAAEMAADALKASGRATLIGASTAGEMLSQSLFDVSDGYVLSLPVADYYSTTHGRIEGAGVTPQIVTDPEQALGRALDEAGSGR